jgi:hypothetical protein
MAEMKILDDVQAAVRAELVAMQPMLADAIRKAAIDAVREAQLTGDFDDVFQGRIQNESSCRIGDLPRAAGDVCRHEAMDHVQGMRTDR